MSTLTRFDTIEGIELVIDIVTGESFATQSGYARMSGKDRTTIVKRCKGCEPGTIISAEIVTSKGLQSCELIPSKLVFKWLLKDNVELAERMGEAGCNVFIHQLAGFKISSSAIVPPIAPPVAPITPPSLPSVTPEERISMATDAMLKFGMDLENPRFKQGYQDWIHQTLGITGGSSALSGTTEQWCGAAERAEELGFGRVGADPSLRVKLGNFLSKSIGHCTERRKEKRVCNGISAEIWLYKVCEKLDNCISEFFQA